MSDGLAKKYLDFRNDLEERGIKFSYCGVLTEDILTGLGDALRQKLDYDGANPAVSRGMFSSFVEQVQNVIRYSAESQSPLDASEIRDNETLRYGLLAIGKSKNGTHFVSCSNMIHTKDMERLKPALEKLRGLDRKQLTTLMKESLRNGPPDGSKGAGVGFITMAREASQGFDFDFTSIDNADMFYFTFEAYF